MATHDNDDDDEVVPVILCTEQNHDPEPGWWPSLFLTVEIMKDCEMHPVIMMSQKKKKKKKKKKILG